MQLTILLRGYIHAGPIGNYFVIIKLFMYVLISGVFNSEVDRCSTSVIFFGEPVLY